jgi:hypothetical protein
MLVGDHLLFADFGPYGIIFIMCVCCSEARAFIARTLDYGFESRLQHGCLSSSFCVVLSCVGRGLATG